MIFDLYILNIQICVDFSQMSYLKQVGNDAIKRSNLLADCALGSVSLCQQVDILFHWLPQNQPSNSRKLLYYTVEAMSGRTYSAPIKLVNRTGLITLSNRVRAHRQTSFTTEWHVFFELIGLIRQLFITIRRQLQMPVQCNPSMVTMHVDVLSIAVFQLATPNPRHHHNQHHPNRKANESRKCLVL